MKDAFKLSQSKSAFSIMELVFVIVILGILSAVAIPKIMVGRTDAAIVSIKTDVDNILYSIPAKILSERIDIATDDLKVAGVTYSMARNNLGKWMVITAGLDEKRWKIRAGENKIFPSYGSNECGGIYIAIMNEEGKNVLKFTYPAIPSDGSFCGELRASYGVIAGTDNVKKGERIIPIDLADMISY